MRNEILDNNLNAQYLILNTENYETYIKNMASKKR